MVPPLGWVRDEAERIFLGKNHVVGVGIVNGKERRLAFLLDTDAGNIRVLSESWASQFAVDIDFLIVGKLSAA